MHGAVAWRPMVGTRAGRGRAVAHPPSPLLVQRVPRVPISTSRSTLLPWSLSVTRPAGSPASPGPAGRRRHAPSSWVKSSEACRSTAAYVTPGKGLEATADSRSVPQTLRCHGREAQAWRDPALCCLPRGPKDGQAHTAGSSHTWRRPRDPRPRLTEGSSQTQDRPRGGRPRRQEEDRTSDDLAE